MSVHVSAALQVLPAWLVLQSVIHTQFKNHRAEQSSQAVHPQPQCRKDIMLPTVLSTHCWSPLECHRQTATKGRTLSTSDTRVKGTHRAPRCSSPRPTGRPQCPAVSTARCSLRQHSEAPSAACPRPRALRAPRPGLPVTGPHAAYCTPGSSARTTRAQIPPIPEIPQRTGRA